MLGVFGRRSWRDSGRRDLRLLFDAASKRQQRFVGSSVDARLAMRQQDRRRDTSRQRLPVAALIASRTPARNTANPLPALAGTHGADLEARLAQAAPCSELRPGELVTAAAAAARCSRNNRLYLYVRCVQVLGRLDRDGRAALRAMAPERPHRVAGARAPRAVGAALAGAGRLVPCHSRGESGDAARRDAPAGGGAGIGAGGGGG